jgi:Ca2+-transporting ATPase
LIFDVLREPMLALLLAGGVIYLILGNRTEALVLLVIFVSILPGFIEWWRIKRAARSTVGMRESQHCCLRRILLPQRSTSRQRFSPLQISIKT